MIPIPQRIAAGIDKIAGEKHRTRFIVEVQVLEAELQRREQLASIKEAAGCWKDENHPELAKGSEAFVRELRNRSEATAGKSRGANFGVDESIATRYRHPHRYAKRQARTARINSTTTSPGRDTGVMPNDHN